MRLRGRRSRAPAGRRLNSPTGGVKPWTPADLAGLLYYFDGDHGRYQERTGASATTPAGDGEAVGTWAAKVGGVYLTTDDDAKRPLARAGSHFSLDFDATNDGMGTLALGSPATVFVTYCSDSNVGSNRRAVQGVASNWLIGFDNTSAFWHFNGTSLGTASQSAGVYRAAVATGVTGGAYQWRVDGTEVSAGTSGSTVVPANVVLMGPGPFTNPPFNEPLNGRVRDFGAYSRVLSAAEIALLETYLMSRTAA